MRPDAVVARGDDAGRGLIAGKHDAQAKLVGLDLAVAVSVVLREVHVLGRGLDRVLHVLNVVGVLVAKRVGVAVGVVQGHVDHAVVGRVGRVGVAAHAVGAALARGRPGELPLGGDAVQGGHAVLAREELLVPVVGVAVRLVAEADHDGQQRNAGRRAARGLRRSPHERGLLGRLCRRGGRGLRLLQRGHRDGRGGRRIARALAVVGLARERIVRHARGVVREVVRGDGAGVGRVLGRAPERERRAGPDHLTPRPIGGVALHDHAVRVGRIVEPLVAVRGDLRRRAIGLLDRHRLVVCRHGHCDARRAQRQGKPQRRGGRRPRNALPRDDPTPRSACHHASS